MSKILSGQALKAIFQLFPFDFTRDKFKFVNGPVSLKIGASKRFRERICNSKSFTRAHIYQVRLLKNLTTNVYFSFFNALMSLKKNLISFIR